MGLAILRVMTDLSLLALAETVALHPMLMAAPASIALQLVGIVWLRGILQSLSLILALVTVTICALAIGAYVYDPRNLWQLVLLLPGPPLFVLTAGVLIMGLIISSRPRRSAPAAFTT